MSRPRCGGARVSPRSALADPGRRDQGVGRIVGGVAQRPQRLLDIRQRRRQQLDGTEFCRIGLKARGGRQRRGRIVGEGVRSRFILGASPAVAHRSMGAGLHFPGTATAGLRRSFRRTSSCKQSRRNGSARRLRASPLRFSVSLPIVASSDSWTDGPAIQSGCIPEPISCSRRRRELGRMPYRVDRISGERITGLRRGPARSSDKSARGLNDRSTS